MILVCRTILWNWRSYRRCRPFRLAMPSNEILEVAKQKALIFGASIYSIAACLISHTMSMNIILFYRSRVSEIIGIYLISSPYHLQASKFYWRNEMKQQLEISLHGHHQVSAIGFASLTRSEMYQNTIYFKGEISWRIIYIWYFYFRVILMCNEQKISINVERIARNRKADARIYIS